MNKSVFFSHLKSDFKTRDNLICISRATLTNNIDTFRIMFKPHANNVILFHLPTSSVVFQISNATKARKGIIKRSI